jgi:hypothetical protein
MTKFDIHNVDRGQLIEKSLEAHAQACQENNFRDTKTIKFDSNVTGRGEVIMKVRPLHNLVRDEAGNEIIKIKKLQRKGFRGAIGFCRRPMIEAHA